MGKSWSRSKKVSPESNGASTSSKHGAFTLHGLLRGVRNRASQRQERPGTVCAPGEDESAQPETEHSRTNGLRHFSSADAEDQRDVSARGHARDQHVWSCSSQPSLLGGPPVDLSPSLLRGPPADLSPSLLRGPPADLSPSLLRGPPADLSPSLLSPDEADVPLAHRTCSGRPLLDIPVHYNCSEEELMESKEREFS